MQLIAPCPLKNKLASPVWQSQQEQSITLTDKYAACSCWQHASSARKDGGNCASSSSMNSADGQDACTVAAIHPLSNAPHAETMSNVFKLRIKTASTHAKTHSAIETEAASACRLNVHTRQRAQEGMAATVPSKVMKSTGMKACTVAAICPCNCACTLAYIQADN